MPQKPDSYHRPESLEEALALLAQPGSAPLGGGTKLLATEAGLPGTAVIDLQALGLNQAKLLSANGTQAVAAGATLTLTKFHQFLQAELPDSPATTLLQTAVHQAGPNTYRNAATLGGIIASRLADSELLAALLVLEATVTLHSPSSQNSVSLADYLADAERPSGLITTVSIPLPTGSGTSHRVARTPADTPIVSITGWRTQDGAVRLAATGLGERPFRLTPAEKADIAQAASAAAAANTHPGDFRGSASYRAEMAAVLTRRTLNQLLND
ncbi:MAG: FAD binding domain-containing protein [Ardenticatenaceae bacterium]|nr:FAD binding domain-containing protein [Anaerolineales bacterium]MCB8939651.1 FAD binding domain-containing protein [Ardenticatenaceae bacterium]MCB8974924.1 FAD binding domain-containing protein [Ardenticatenaceae bacterium]